ncbi:hypothetical protein [Paenisporosarcina sp. NPDC076898]|uniref:hypothetical protein n=1 Tax=unclassified Paenisporosarcina TaxID=2642018 RepID=UPI003CFF48E6
MKFKEKIEAHQEGKYDFAAELLQLAQSEITRTELSYIKREYPYFDQQANDVDYVTFYHWRPKYFVKEDKPEFHVAIKLKIILERHAKKPKRIKRQLQSDDYELHDMYTLLTRIGYHIHVDDFDKITPKMLKRIKKLATESEHDEFMAGYKKYMQILPRIKREQKQYYDEISPLILETLYEVLLKVNLERTDDEIIGFITISTKNRIYRKLNKLLQTKVVNRNGEKYWINKVDVKFKNVNIDKMLRINEEKLTNNQMFFYDKLKTLIQKELDVKNPIPFVIDKDNNFIDINKRYFAKKMEIEESAFKKRLKRLQDKRDKDFFAKMAK